MDNQVPSELVPELVAALRELAENAKMASFWVPHILLIGAVEKAESVLHKIDGK